MIESPVSVPLGLATKVLASKDVLAAELGDEVSLLDLKSGIYFTLNPVGATVWRQIQEAKSVAGIKQQLLAEYNVDIERCEGDLRQLLAELKSSGLIELIPA